MFRICYFITGDSCFTKRVLVFLTVKMALYQRGQLEKMAFEMSVKAVSLSPGSDVPLVK